MNKKTWKKPLKHIFNNKLDLLVRTKKKKSKNILSLIKSSSLINTKTKEIAIKPTISVKEKGTLNISDIIRPYRELKRSMEGFFLDQNSSHTQVAYLKDLKRFIKFLLLRKSEDRESLIDRNIIVGYKDHLLHEKLEHSTIDRHLATLKSFFNWLLEDGFIEKNPAERVRFLRPERISKTIGFTDEEVRRVLSLPNLHTVSGSQHYSILMILFYCGLRRSEICLLRTSNIGKERNHRVLRLRGKGNKERIVVLVEAVWNSLIHYFIISGKRPEVDQYLFTPKFNNRTKKINKPLDSSMIYYIVKRYSKQAGILNKVSPHSCRATAISNARDHNVSDRAIQEFAGWSTVDMITRYDKRKINIEESAAHAIKYGDARRQLVTKIDEIAYNKSLD